MISAAKDASPELSPGITRIFDWRGEGRWEGEGSAFFHLGIRYFYI